MRKRAAITGPLIGSLFGFALASSALGAATAADDVVATTTQGQVRGGSADGAEFFMGMPYARPPVGDWRWREPQAPASWSGVRDATRPGAICPQRVRPGSTEPAPSEDCLFINVWRPAHTKPGAKLPVMLWYHGGGMVFGSGSSTDGRYIAQKGVILVTMNYRLGNLGVFAHPALTSERPGAVTGNYTLMDAVAALRWVRTNIAGFGGDPANVTIFGFSAGAQIVNTVMVTPSARGLFAKAITQSGLGRNYGHEGQNRILPVRGPAAETGEKTGLAIAEKLGITGTGPAALKALRAVPPEPLELESSSLPGSMIDGELLPEPIAVAYGEGHEAPVPQIIGRTICERCGVKSITDRPEATFARSGALRARAAALYGGEGGAAATEFASDLDHGEPARLLARLHARNGRPTWSYVFDYTTPRHRGEKMGPSHGDDIPYIFGTLKSPTGRRFDPTAADLAMSDTILTFWTNFAKNGDPGSAKGVRWTPFRQGQGQEAVMVFGNDGPRLDPAFREERFDLAERVNASHQAKSYIPK